MGVISEKRSQGAESPMSTLPVSILEGLLKVLKVTATDRHNGDVFQ